MIQSQQHNAEGGLSTENCQLIKVKGFRLRLKTFSNIYMCTVGYVHTVSRSHGQSNPHHGHIVTSKIKCTYLIQSTDAGDFNIKNKPVLKRYYILVSFV